MPVLLYWGEEDFNIESSVREFREKIIDPSWAGMNHKRLNEPDLRTLIETIEATPLMFGNLLIEVNANNFFLRGGQGTGDDKLLARLTDNLEHINEKIYVLFICIIPRGTGKKIDSTKKITKAVKKIANIVEFPAFKSYEDKKIVDWIINRAKTKDVKISSSNALLMAAQVGGELRKLDIELDKLKMAVHPSKTIEKSHIEALCQDSENIFVMADYWIKNERVKALAELDKLLDKSHPVPIIGALQSTLKKWIRIKAESKNNPPSEIARIVGLHEFVVKKELEKLQRVTLDELIRRRHVLTKAESGLKSGEIQPELALEMVISI